MTGAGSILALLQKKSHMTCLFSAICKASYRNFQCIFNNICAKLSLMKILIIEDEKPLANALAEILKRSGYLSDITNDGEEGLAYALTEIYDFIILDLMLPKLSGMELLKKLREKKVFTPVLILSAKSEISDRVSGLNLGADDYLTKPFSSEELIARVRAVSRRRGEVSSDMLEFGSLLLNTGTYELSDGNKSIKLGVKEYQIMEMLMAAKGNLIPKERFMEKIWGYDSDAEYNAIEVYVSFLRKKLTAISAKTTIKAVRGVGYSLEKTT